jgi:hypothetical protein
LQNYIDMDKGNAGQCEEPYDGWEIKYDSRAPGSIVKSDIAELDERTRNAIRRALVDQEVPRGITVPTETATVWELEGAVLLVTFDAQSPSTRTETEGVWSKSLDKVVQKPAYANVFSAALWVEGDTAIIVHQKGESDAYLETYFLAVSPQDVADLDGDGDPEITLYVRNYESESLEVYTIGDEGVTKRLRLWGCSL